MAKLAPVVATRRPPASSAFLKRRDEQSADETGIAEPHLGLGGMNIDVDLARIGIDEQCDDRMPVARHQIGIGTAQRADQQAILHRSAIDDKELMRGGGAIIGRHAGKAREPEALPLGRDLDRIGTEIRAKHIGQPGAQAIAGRALAGEADRASVDHEGEVDLRAGRGQAANDFDRGFALGTIRLQEFEAGRQRREQVLRLDPRAGRVGGGLDLAHPALIDDELRGMGGRRRGATSG